MDRTVLENALHEVSKGSMTAPARAVYDLAVERWAYPGTFGQSLAEFLKTERYRIVRGGGELFIRPVEDPAH